ncbi:MAG: pyridine nucleotide-disulfide oxidoreductase, partial [Oscillospiraceae bacterium]|nr:pyridine nucleotide-disulfide oxidoreductase [Oscillospiraceae bacterium]
EEAARAGRKAAEYIKGGSTPEKFVEIKTAGGVRYTVPQRISPDTMDDKITLRFRVGDILKNKTLAVYFDAEPVRRVKKRIMAPGEMEELVLTKASFAEHPDVKEILVCAED